MRPLYFRLVKVVYQMTKLRSVPKTSNVVGEDLKVASRFLLRSWIYFDVPSFDEWVPDVGGSGSVRECMV